MELLMSRHGHAVPELFGHSCLPPANAQWTLLEFKLAFLAPAHATSEQFGSQQFQRNGGFYRFELGGDDCSPFSHLSSMGWWVVPCADTCDSNTKHSQARTS